MGKTKAVFLSILLAALFTITFSQDSFGQCYGSLALSPDFFGYDFLVRLCIHFGGAESIPGDIQCHTSLDESEEEVDFPVFLYNAHEGMRYLEFGVEANDSIVSFAPENGFMIFSAYNYTEGDVYKLDLALKSMTPVCGPVLIGYVKVKRAHDVDPIWVDLVQNGQTNRMMAQDESWYSHYIFPPQHGGYAGSGYLYACQPPICSEPNMPVENFTARMSHGCAVELRWTAGGGNTTVIRCRSDRYPTGYNDGDLVVEMPSTPGEEQYYFQTGIQSGVVLYYKAFSLTKDANGYVLNNSFVECSSVDTVMTDCEIAVEESSWGEIKSLYK